MIIVSAFFEAMKYIFMFKMCSTFKLCASIYTSSEKDMNRNIDLTQIADRSDVFSFRFDNRGFYCLNDFFDGIREQLKEKLITLIGERGAIEIQTIFIVTYVDNNHIVRDGYLELPINLRHSAGELDASNVADLDRLIRVHIMDILMLVALFLDGRNGAQFGFVKALQVDVTSKCSCKITGYGKR